MTLETILSSGILNYLVGFLIIAGIYALFTLGLNVQFGETGLINFGIAGFLRHRRIHGGLGHEAAALPANWPAIPSRRSASTSRFSWVSSPRR